MTNNTRNQQMEMTFTRSAALRPRRFRSHRQPGAAWWFAQMRKAVDRAPDWQNNPPTGISLQTPHSEFCTPNAPAKIAA